jgi:predicted ArsR family transcriptional regulator
LATRWDQRFLESKRGQIVALLRRSGRTVEELAQALDLTANGIRAHLAVLERDGVVRQRGYEPVLRRLLDVLAERLGPEGSEALLKSVGHRMAEGRVAPTGGIRSRLEAAVEVLNELGGLAELEEHDGGLVIRGYSCPLAAVTPVHPEVCRMAETLIAELAGVPVHERCDRGERPRCCFEIASADDTTPE